MKITDSIKYIGVTDKNIDLFEGQYLVPQGMLYNSYFIEDEKIALISTVDKAFTHEWLDNISMKVNGRKIDYLIIQHMEPDHSASISSFIEAYPDTEIVANELIFAMMDNFFPGNSWKKIIVKDGDIFDTGKHKLKFISAPMVHWPEVMVIYEETEKILFSADAFGKFGAETSSENWDDEARRYYIGIIGKYGVQVVNLFKKLNGLEIKIICPLHGPVLNDRLEHCLNLYNTWATYKPEEKGIVIVYTSVYGNTKKAVDLLIEQLRLNKCPDIAVYDLARCDMSQAVADAFKYEKLVLATTTYNADIFPFMRDFIEHLTERKFQNRIVALIENGSWSPMAIKIMKGKLCECKNIEIMENSITIRSGLSKENVEEIKLLAEKLCKDYCTR